MVIEYTVKNASFEYLQKLHEEWKRAIARNEAKSFKCEEKLNEATNKLDLCCVLTV